MTKRDDNPIHGDPPPAAFKRTPEQEAEARDRLDAETKRMKAKGIDPRADRRGELELSRRKPYDEDAIEALRQRAESWQAERKALVCWRELYPNGAPEGFTELRISTRSAIRARQACDAAGARATCPYGRELPTCLYGRAGEMREAVHEHLSRGLGKEAEDEHKLVLASVDAEKPVPLLDYDPMKVVRQWLTGERGGVQLENGAELAPLSGAIAYPGAAHFEGGERLLILGGNPGRGKTVAAVYAIARVGGLYVLEYSLGRPFNVDAAVATRGVLVIDQIQPADHDEKRRAALRMDEIVHRRSAGGKRTLLIGNIDYATFVSRYGQLDETTGEMKHPGIICERCRQSGVFVLFGGESVRDRMGAKEGLQPRK